MELKCYKCGKLFEVEDFYRPLIENRKIIRPACDLCISELKKEHQNYPCHECGERMAEESWYYEFVNENLVKIHQRCRRNPNG